MRPTRFPLFLLVVSLLFPIAGFTQSDTMIFATDAPEIWPLWHRVADFSDRLRSVEACEFSPDGRLAASASKFGYRVMLWRVADGQLLWERQHESEVECLTFSPDGKRLASGGEDFFVRIWDVETGTELYQWEHDSGLDGITWSHDGRLIASGSEGGDAFLWDATNYRLVARIPAGSTINSLHFSSDDQWLAVGGNIQYPHPETGRTVYDGFVKVIDVAQRRVARTFEGPTGSVKSVRLSANGRWLASGGFDQTARLFNFKTGELLHTWTHPLRVEAVAFTPDNQFLLVGGHELSIKVYRLADYQLSTEIPSPRTEYLDISADGRLLLSGHEDSGLLSLRMFLSNTQHRGNYHQLSDRQLNNRDLRKN